MKGRKRKWEYRIQGLGKPLYAEITGRFYNQGMYVDPVLRVVKIVGPGPMDFEVIHHSTAKNVKTLKNRLSRLTGIKNINLLQIKEEKKCT